LACRVRGSAICRSLKTRPRARRSSEARGHLEASEGISERESTSRSKRGHLEASEGILERESTSRSKRGHLEASEGILERESTFRSMRGYKEASEGILERESRSRSKQARMLPVCRSALHTRYNESFPSSCSRGYAPQGSTPHQQSVPTS